MDDPFLRIIIGAMALGFPVALAGWFLEWRTHQKSNVRHQETKLLWIQQYRSSTDIIMTLVERHKTMLDRVEKQNVEVLAFLEKLLGTKPR